MEGAPKHKEPIQHSSYRVDPVTDFDTLKPQVSTFQVPEPYIASDDARPMSAVEPADIRPGGKVAGHVPPQYDSFGRQLPRHKSGSGLRIRKGMPGMWHPDTIGPSTTQGQSLGIALSSPLRASGTAGGGGATLADAISRKSGRVQAIRANNSSLRRAGADGKRQTGPEMATAGTIRPLGATAKLQGGNPRLYSTKSNAPLIPAQWQKKVPLRTHTELRQARKARMRPHISFDLDGDGVVSQMDFFFASQFDADQSGVLRAGEKKKACDAMAAGYADNFVKVRSGVTQSVHHRVVQRRGEVLADDREGGWGRLTNTRRGGVDGSGNPESKEDRDRRLLAKLPYANQGPGGAAQAMYDSPERGTLRATAEKHGLRSRSQLLHARRVEEAQRLDRTFAKRYGLTALPGLGGQASSDASHDGAGGGPGGMSLAGGQPGSPTFTEVPQVDGETKPYSGPESRPPDARAAKSRAELLRLRQKQRLVDSLRAGGDSSEAGRVERAPSPVSDDEASLRRTGPMGGLANLSLTQSQLLQRRKALALDEAKQKDRRPVGVGIHGKALPSMEEHAGDVPWFEKQRQQRPRSTVDRPWRGGSALDGDGQDDLRKSTGPGVVARRGARLDERTGKPVVRSGLVREEDPDEKEFSFKTRTVRLLDMESYRKKKHLDFAEKPTRLNHWTAARAAADGAAPGETIRSSYGGGPSAVHVLPPAGGSGGGGGTTVGATKRFSTRRWTDAQLEHRALAEQEEEDAHLDDDGKELYTNPKDWAPMYSSFATDRVFRDGWNTKKPSFRARPVGPGSQLLRSSQSSTVLRRSGGRHGLAGGRLDPSHGGSALLGFSGAESQGRGPSPVPPIQASRRDSIEKRAYDGTFGSAAFNSTPAWPGAMKRRASIHGTPALLPSQEAAAAASGGRGSRTGPVRLLPPPSDAETELREALESRGRQVPPLMLSDRGAKAGGAAGVRAARRNSVEETLPPRAPPPVVRPVPSPIGQMHGTRPGSALAQLSGSSHGGTVSPGPGFDAGSGGRPGPTARQQGRPGASQTSKLGRSGGLSSSASQPALFGSGALGARPGRASGTFRGLHAALRTEHDRVAKAIEVNGDKTSSGLTASQRIRTGGLGH